MLDGIFFAVKRFVVQQILFDEGTFDGFHCYDTDFTYSAYLAGFALAVCNDIAVIHYSNRGFGGEFQEFNRRFIVKHAATIDSPEPLMALPPIHAWDTCADRQGVLNSFLPEVQVSVCQQFLDRFPVLRATPSSPCTGMAIKQARRLAQFFTRRVQLFIQAVRAK